MPVQEIDVFEFIHHGWKFAMPIRIDAQDQDQRDMIIDALALAMDNIGEQVRLIPSTEQEALDILNGENIKPVELHFFTFFTPVWEAASFKDAVHWFADHRIHNEKGTPYLKLKEMAFDAGVTQVSKGLNLSDIHLHVDVVIPDRIVSRVFSKTDILNTEHHEFLFNREQLNKTPGTVYMVRFDPEDTEIRLDKFPHQYIDDQKNVIPVRKPSVYPEKLRVSIPPEAQKFYRENGFQISDNRMKDLFEIDDEKKLSSRDVHLYDYLILEAHSDFMGQLKRIK